MFDTGNSINVNYCIVTVIIIVITNTVEFFISLKKLNLIFAPFRNIKVMGKRIDINAFEERDITSDSLALTWETVNGIIYFKGYHVLFS